jgi:hypothetical protein
MKTNEINYTQIATQVVNELATTYALPELRGAQLVQRKRADKVTNFAGGVATAPSGQIAAIVRSMLVEVEIEFASGEEGQLYTNARLSYHYEHHNGGRNGCSRDFTVVVNRQFGESRYVGLVDKMLLHHAIEMTRVD